MPKERTGEWYGTDGMCGYAFVAEPAPPRTVFREGKEEAARSEDGPMTLTEEAAVNTLPDYPEAYRAFLQEVARLEALGERAP